MQPISLELATEQDIVSADFTDGTDKLELSSIRPRHTSRPVAGNSLWKSRGQRSPVPRQGIIVATLVLLMLGGCALVGIKPSIINDIRGSVADDIYTSPSGRFRVRVPKLVQPGAVVRDVVPAPGPFIVAFVDDLCRLFMVQEHERELTEGQTIEMAADVYEIPNLEKAN